MNRYLYVQRCNLDKQHQNKRFAKSNTAYSGRSHSTNDRGSFGVSQQLLLQKLPIVGGRASKGFSLTAATSMSKPYQIFLFQTRLPHVSEIVQISAQKQKYCCVYHPFCHQASKIPSLQPHYQSVRWDCFIEYRYYLFMFTCRQKFNV